jgi:DNA adenine methylase
VNVPTAEARLNSLRPPLKWAGGKRWLVPTILELWNECGRPRLIEPLCGGLAIALGLMPARAVLSDINPHNINFYKWLKSGLRVSLRMENRAELYYAHRERFNELIESKQAESKEAAALFYYLNRTGYNGLCRFNSSGHFNVPFGKYRHILYREDFSSYRLAFGRWTFRCGDFEAIELSEGDFVYADPPYDVEFTRYSQQDFRWDEQVRLARWLTKHRGPAVISNQATERVVRLYETLGFQTRILKAPRRISCTGDRTPADEVLAVRNLRLEFSQQNTDTSPERSDRRFSSGESHRLEDQGVAGAAALGVPL